LKCDNVCEGEKMSEVVVAERVRGRREGTWRIKNRIMEMHCMFVRIMEVVRFLCRKETEKVVKNEKGKGKGNGNRYVCSREQKAQCPNKGYCYMSLCCIGFRCYWGFFLSAV